MNHQKFAEEWIKAWNSHDLDVIFSHYSDDIEIVTPMIKLAALEKYPDLHFELIKSTAGVDSVALFYKSIMDKHAMEVMFFNEDGKINKMYAHYD